MRLIDVMFILEPSTRIRIYSNNLKNFIESKNSSLIDNLGYLSLSVSIDDLLESEIYKAKEFSSFVEIYTKSNIVENYCDENDSSYITFDTFTITRGH